jgi:hypothetical protein
MQDLIVRRGEMAGQQVVAEANERAQREEKLIREMEARKEADDKRKLESKAAAREQMRRAVDESRRKQVELKEKLKAQKVEEARQHVAEVSMTQLACCSASAVAWCCSLTSAA